MLRVLRIQDFAIIDELEIELGPGLNVVTGETGAGKSILVDALELVLGAKGRPELVRTGCKQATVEALFDHIEAGPMRIASAALEQVDGELVVRRVLSSQGRSRAYLAGTMCTIKELQHLAGSLCDISSQHEHHSLTEPRAHLEYLDAFGELIPLRRRVADVCSRLRQALRQEERIVSAHRDRLEREDLLRFQVQEIEDLSPSAGEIGTLEDESRRLHHAEKLLRTASNVEEYLYGRDDAVTSELGRWASEMAAAGNVDAQLKAYASVLEEAKLLLEDVSHDLGRYSRSVVVDPERLAFVDQRLDTLRQLIKKYGGRSGLQEASLSAVLAFREQAQAELEAIESSELQFADLKAQVARARKEAAAAARELSLARRESAAQLGDAISKELDSLAMGNARVEVQVSPLAGSSEELEIDGARFTEMGIDHVEFLIAPNPGEEARPLRQIASGGELSRSLLAIKRVLAGLRNTGLYVFDEVDTGVGGAVAEVIGRKLKDVSRHHQVLCITHLPQIAVFADQHFRVEKQVVEGRTRSRISALSEAERLDEISRMLGGIRVSKKTRAAAAELIAAAQ